MLGVAGYQWVEVAGLGGASTRLCSTNACQVRVASLGLKGLKVALGLRELKVALGPRGFKVAGWGGDVYPPLLHSRLPPAGEGFGDQGYQVYLAHKKQRPPRTLPQDYA